MAGQLHLSLGVLDLLPQERRDIIYDLVIPPATKDEVDLHSPRKTSSSALNMVSQQVRRECAARLCEHAYYFHTLPPLDVPKERILLEDMPGSLRVGNQHNLRKVKTIRFLTGHLNADVPLAVVVQLRLRTESTAKVYGASEEEDEYVQPQLNEALLELEDTTALEGIAPKTALNAMNIIALAVRVRDIVCGRIQS